MATKEAVFSLRVDTGNSVQDIQNADKAVKNFNKDLKETQVTAASGTGVNKMQTDLQALNAKVEAGGLTMRQMTQAMKEYQSIAAQAGVESPVGQEAIRSAAELKDRIGDLKGATTALSSDFVKLDTTIAAIGVGASVFQGLSSAISLSGIENENLTKTMVKLQAVQGVSNAVSQIANALNKDAILGIQLRTAIEKVRALVLGDTKTATLQQAASEGILATTTTATAVATTGASMAMKAFKMALIGTGIGALVVGLGFLVSNLESVGNALGFTSAKQKELEEKTKQAAAAADEQRKEVAKESGSFALLISRLKDTNAGSKERKVLMKEANDRYGVTLANISSEAKFQNALNVELANYLVYQRAKYELQKNEKAIIANLEKQDLLKQKEIAANATLLALQKQDKINKDAEDNRPKSAGGGKRTVDIKLENFAIKDQINTINDLKKQQKDNEVAFESFGKAANDAGKKISGLTNEGTKYVEQVPVTKASIDKVTDSYKGQNDVLQNSLNILKDKLARDIEANESAENLKISIMAEGKSKQLAILEETYGDFRDNLIKKSNKTELDALDEKFKTGKIKEEDYRKELALIMETGSKNFSDAENNLMTLTTEKLIDDKRRLNLTAQELEIDDINKSFDQKDITEAERLIKIQEINNKYLKIQTDKDAENETKRKNRAKLLNAILLNETQLAIQNEINLFDEQAKELDKLLLSENENEKITQEEHDKAMIELEKKKVKAIADINKKATETSTEATKKEREEELKGISAGIAKAEDALEKIKMVNELLNEIGTARINKINKERDEDLLNLDAKQQAELNAEGLTAEQKTGIEEKFAKQKYAVQLDAFNKEDKINRAKFNRDKAIKLAEVGINTASAIVKGIAEFGPPPSPAGIAAIATAGIIGTTQALAIINQKYQGGTMPTMPSVSSSGGGGLAGSSASSFTSQATTQTSTTGLTDGQSITAPVQVFVLENDISSTQNKVALQESKSSF
jgi:hypothetical protein